MKYTFALITFVLVANLSAYEKFPASYWWDNDKNVFVEIEGHIFEINPENHSMDCPCDWDDCPGMAYVNSVRAVMD